MVTRKASSAQSSAVSRRRARSHSLAPEHIGEAGSVAMLALIVLGMAIFIAGVAMIVSGLTISSRFTGATPPPNLAELGYSQVMGGIGLVVLGVLQAGSGLAMLAGLSRSRLAATIVASVSAILAIGGVVLVMGQQTAVPLLAGVLAVGAVIYAASAIVLLRPQR